jgi:large subunit ribosomal protein L13
MDRTSFKTTYVNKQTATRDWVLLNAEDEILGRLASKAAKLLRGKYKPNFSPHVDCGDHVIIINAEKVKFTGNKLTDKEYVRHSGYPGGQRSRNAEVMLKFKPEFIIEHAIKGMLPKNRLGSQIFKNLHVYIGDKHPHEAQKPKEIKLNSIK